MKENFEIAYRILKEFHKNGILDEVILIGSWCLFFYRDMFNNTSEIHEVKTLDIDFLVPDNRKIKGDYNIPEILKGLKFMEHFSPESGKVKYVSPDIEVEFLIVEQGKGHGGKAVPVPKLGVSAIGLRYLNLLSGHTMGVKFEGMTITVPEPSAFALHKFIISERRFKNEKREKDLITAAQLGKFIVQVPEQRNRMIEIFTGLPQNWRKTILGIVKEKCVNVYEVLKD